MPRAGVVVTVLAMAMVVSASVRVAAQSAPPADGGMRFEVASIKTAMSPAEMGRAAAARGAGPGGRISFPNLGVRVQPGGRLVGIANLQALILRAYGIREYQLDGGPKWLTTDYFDITAKAESETATEADLNAMLRSLLTERFGLRVHVETRQVPVFTLKARPDGRYGPGLKRTSAECERELEERKRTGASAPPPPLPSGPQPRIEPVCGRTMGMVNARNAVETYASGGRPFSDLVSRLSSDLKAPVTDQTGLTGLFDVVLEFESARQFAGQPPGPDLNSTDPLPVPLPAAVQQQLGLTLEKGTGPLPITIIDAADHPTPN
jgi:uncharacterized protein (TIGR03435 family)